MCSVVSHQRYSTDLDEEMSFLQVSILQLIRFVWVVQCTDQLIHLQQVILAWRQKHGQNVENHDSTYLQNLKPRLDGAQT